MSTAGQSERVSETTGASSSNSPRASMTAVPCSPIGPESRIRSPGRSEPGESEARGSMRPRPVVVTYIESHLPRSTTLVSPAMISTPAARAAAAIASTSARRSSAERPSSSTSESVSASGRAPAIARSLTVPLTASSPIEPPGKRIGLTTKLSVVIASPSITPASPSSRSASPPKAGTKSPFTRVCVALPPAPCAIVIWVSRNRAGRERTRSISARASDSRVSLGVIRPPARGRSGRSCSTRRTRPRTRPCRCRWAVPACRPCRRPCTPTAG